MGMNITKGRAAVAVATTAIAVGSAAGVAYAAGHDAGDTRAVIELSAVGDSGFGVLDLGKPGDGNRLSSIKTLSTDFAALAGSDCGSGTPRFQIAVETPSGENKNVFVYLGAYPNYTGCTPGWQHSGNLADPSTRWDTSQLGGTFYDPADHAVATFGTYKVVGVSVVVEGDGQDFVFNGAEVNGHSRSAHIG